jgi:hypothetical protein
MGNLEKCPERLQRFYVEWQAKSSRKGIYLILNRLIPQKVGSNDIIIYLIITTIKWCKSSQTVGHHFKFLFLRKPFMLEKNGIKVFDHIFSHKLTQIFLEDHSLTPCIIKYP